LKTSVMFLVERLRFKFMDYPACLDVPTAHNTFGGVFAAQAWRDLALWEVFLSNYPSASLVELGTWRGGMALFLGSQCLLRDMPFVTIEGNLGQVQRPDLIERVGGKLMELDLLGGDAAIQMKALLEDLPKPVCLFCDNGDKRREWKAFVPLLESGDRIVVHDWGHEFFEQDVDPVAEMVLKGECEAVGSITRFFILP